MIIGHKPKPKSESQFCIQNSKQISIKWKVNFVGHLAIFYASTGHWVFLNFQLDANFCGANRIKVSFLTLRDISLIERDRINIPEITRKP